MMAVINIRRDGSAHIPLFLVVRETDVHRTDVSCAYYVHLKSGDMIEIDPDQAWFWTPSWQEGEREVDEDLTADKYEEFGSMDEFLNTL